MKIATAEQMRAIDRAAIEQHRIPALELMRRAGLAVAEAVLELYEPDSVAVACGKGNNAGDGFIAAAALHARGVNVTVLLLEAPEKLRGAAAEAYAELAKLLADAGQGASGAGRAPRVLRVENAEQLDAAELHTYDLLIDALFGTGLKGPLEGFWAQAVDIINAVNLPVVAIDIPSGLPAEPATRQDLIKWPVMNAAQTVTLGLPKLGMCMEGGIKFTGHVSVEPIGFPANLLNDSAITTNMLTLDEAGWLLPRREPDGHKGTFGKVLIAAGSAGMTGAAVLAALAAARSGVGLVYSAYPEPLTAIMESHLVEPVKLLLPGEARWFVSAHAAPLLEYAREMQAVGIGPGLGRRTATAEFLKAMIKETAAPLVLDADALVLLSDFIDVLKKRKPGTTILTPHPGEAARLLGLKSAAELDGKRLDAFVHFAKEYNVITVLKGAQTIITLPDGQRWINPTGGSGLAKGGTGDVLTGLLTGLLGQGMQPADATKLGVFLHGMAGDLAAEKLTPRAMLASDVIDNLPGAFQQLMKM